MDDRRMSPSSPDDSAWPRLDELLDVALDLPDAERAALLERLGRENPSLRARLESLLAADAAAGTFLTGDAAGWLPGVPAFSPPESDTPFAAGVRIGPYCIVQEIGRGGMGIVYLAERADGEFEQRVALKLVRRGLEEDEIARFRRERQILARLDHPSIARLFDGGVHGDGRPWFAMELVEGEPITAYCDGRRLPIDARLRLFRRVCDAVQYAHGNLVVHRDLKPSNILVSPDGTLKLLDFGIAKLLGDASAAEPADLTRTGSRFLTPAYAAPEQLRSEAVSTATDVYALGVILFELLTGRRPFGGRDSRAADLERAILEREPSRPSTVVTSRDADGAGDPAPGAAASARGASPASLRRRLAGDLDAIVLKALRKEPLHRYPTAAALAEDVERSLDGRPVKARPEGRRYRAAKFVRRHRAALTAAALLALSLVGGLGAAAWQARQKTIEARKAEAVKDFLISIFRQADPVQSAGADISLRQVLDRGAERTSLELAGQPEVRGEMLTALAGIYAELGVLDRAAALNDEALAIHERLHGSGSDPVATNLRQQASLAAAKGSAKEAEALARRALAIHERNRGAGHPEVAEDLDVLVIALRQRGAIADALGLAERSLAIRRAAFGEEHRLVAESLNNLAVLTREQGRYDEAAGYYREAVDLRRRLLGDAHPHVALTLHNFAALEHFRGRYLESSALADQARKTFVKLYGEEHPLTLAARSTRAANDRMLGRFDEAEAGMRGILEVWGRTLGAEHPNALVTLGGLARVHRERGNVREAEALLRELDARWRTRMGAAHPVGAVIRRQLGGVLAEQGRYDEAGPLLHEALDRLRAVHGDAHPEVAESLYELGVLHHRRGDLAAARERLEASLALRRRLLGERHVVTGQTLSALGAVLREAGEPSDARRALEQAMGILREALPAGHPAIEDAARELSLVGLGDRGARDATPARTGRR